MPSELTQATVELPLDYYHQNFCQFLSVVQRRYGDLLSLQERDFLKQFYAARKESQCLYVRLSGRRKSLYRLSKLQYVEIPALADSAKELAALGLLSLNPTLELQQLLPLYNKSELISRLQPSGAAKLNRKALEMHLIEHADEQSSTTLQADDNLIQLLQEEHLPVFRLCYFGNLYQDLSEFVLRDLAVFQYEQYSLDSHSRQFVDREQLEQHLLYYACSDLSDAAVEAGATAVLALSDALPEAREQDHTLKRRVSRLRNRLARDLERQKLTASALKIYRLSSCTPARERRARIKMSNGETEQSLALCRQILSSPRDEAEAVFAQQFGHRHAKRHGIDWPNSPISKAPVKRICLAKSNTVELSTAQYLQSSGECRFVENALFCSLLGLAIWPAVFAPIAGAFSHPFQNRPHDYHESDFRLRRAEIIERALALQCRDQREFERQILITFERKFGLSNPLVRWSQIDEMLLLTALQRIPSLHLQQIFKRLLRDLRHHCNGLPDLIHFPTEGGYELIEVKGPGDRLQNNQKRWMSFFHTHDIPHWVAQVNWLEQAPHD